MNDNTKILGYTPDQVEAVTNELKNTILDLITLSESQGVQTAVNTVVIGLALRVAILDGLITPEEGENLVLDTDRNFEQIARELQERAFLKFFGA